MLLLTTSLSFRSFRGLTLPLLFCCDSFFFLAALLFESLTLFLFFAFFLEPLTFFFRFDCCFSIAELTITGIQSSTVIRQLLFEACELIRISKPYNIEVSTRVIIIAEKNIRIVTREIHGSDKPCEQIFCLFYSFRS